MLQLFGLTFLATICGISGSMDAPRIIDSKSPVYMQFGATAAHTAPLLYSVPRRNPSRGEHRITRTVNCGGYQAPFSATTTTTRTSPQRPPHRGRPQRTPRTPRRTTTPTPQTRTRTRTPAVHHLARHHRAPHATDGPQFHATTTRSGLRQQQRTASCSSASGLGRDHSSGPAETHPRGDRGVPGE